MNHLIVEAAMTRTIPSKQEAVPGKHRPDSSRHRPATSKHEPIPSKHRPIPSNKGPSPIKHVLAHSEQQPISSFKSSDRYTKPISKRLHISRMRCSAICRLHHLQFLVQIQQGEGIQIQLQFKCQVQVRPIYVIYSSRYKYSTSRYSCSNSSAVESTRQPGSSCRSPTNKLDKTNIRSSIINYFYR